MTGENVSAKPECTFEPIPADEFNQFGLGSEEVAMHYLQAAMPGTVWSLRKLRELTNAGKIIGFKQGRRWFFKRDDLDGYVSAVHGSHALATFVDLRR
jgi:hypothetical protein